MGAVAAEALADWVKVAVPAILNSPFGNDQTRRERFARELVAQACQKFPGVRAVAVAVGHKIEGAYTQIHADCNNYSLGTSTGYELYVVGPKQHAKFSREGDGGFINWAYQGRNIWRGSNGTYLEFHDHDITDTGSA